MSMPTKAKLAAARFVAAQKAPYFTGAVTALVPREVADGTLPTRTMAVTKNGLLIYEKGFVDATPVPELAGVLLHETNHIIRDHHSRLNATMNPVRWNIAADMEINDDLRQMKVQLPKGGVYPDSYKLKDGLTAEEYYAELEKQDPTPPGAGSPQDPGCGSGAGNPQPGEEQFDQDPHGRSAAEMESVRQQPADQVRAHEAKHGRGSVSNSLSRWASDKLKPSTVPWQQKLRRTIRGAVASKSGSQDYKFGRISRRQAGVGYGPGKPILPALVSPIPEVFIAVDSSGSMGHEEIMSAVRETDAVLRATSTKPTFVVCDAVVHAQKKIRSIAEIAPLLNGGGGTDFRPMFDALEQTKPRPHVAIFITDGGGPAPKDPPKDVKVIWVLVGQYRRKPYTARGDEVKYGEFIEVEA